MNENNQIYEQEPQQISLGFSGTKKQLPGAVP